MSYATRKRKSNSTMKRQVLPRIKAMDNAALSFLDTLRNYISNMLPAHVNDLNNYIASGATGITDKWNTAIKGLSFVYSDSEGGIGRTTTTTGGQTKTVAEVYRIILLCDLQSLLDLSSIADKTVTEADQVAMVSAMTPNPLYTLQERDKLATEIGNKYPEFDITIQEFMSKSSTDQVSKDLLAMETGLIEKLTTDNITSLNLITDILAGPFTAGEILTTIGKTYTGVRQINTTDPPCSVKSLSCVGLVPDNNITYITPCDTTNEGLSGSTTVVQNANYYYKLQYVISLPDTDTNKTNVATAAGTTPANLSMAILDNSATMLNVTPELDKITTIPNTTPTTLCTNNTSDDCVMWDAYTGIFSKTYAVRLAHKVDKILYCCNPKIDKLTYLLAAIIKSTNYTTLLEDTITTPPVDPNNTTKNKTVFYIIAAVIVLVIIALLVIIFKSPKTEIVAVTPPAPQTFASP